MGRVDVPATKRAGLPVDLDRLATDGDDWLTDEDRLALKKHGICGQGQPGVFMVRIRTSGGTLNAVTAEGLADLAEEHGKGWLHLTTRQQVQLHHVEARDVPGVISWVDDLGLTTSSTCGHTLRGVMSCAAAGAGWGEPFDCYPDARAVSDSIMERTPELNYELPQRVNILFGGCEECREHARTNEIGFVSSVRDGTPGYELWVGGSLGKSSPTLAFQALDFVPRADALAAANALVDVFVEYGDFDRPHRARLKFLVRELGQEDFTAVFETAYAARRRQDWPDPAAVPLTEPDARGEVLASSPVGGWGSGVRPQRTAGRAMLTVNVPMGDLDSPDMRRLAGVARADADGRLYLTKNQNVLFRDVAVAEVPAARQRLAEADLRLEGADQSVDTRVCTGGPVCSLATTPSTSLGAELMRSPAVARNSSLRVHVSGCVNGCAQHQIAPIGFSGSKVTIEGERMLGYQVWLGGDVGEEQIAEVVGRVAREDAVAVTEAIIGLWEAIRDPAETLPATVARTGVEPFASHVETVCTGRWASGPEPEEGVPRGVSVEGDRDLPLVAA